MHRVAEPVAVGGDFGAGVAAVAGGGSYACHLVLGAYDVDGGEEGERGDGAGEGDSGGEAAGGLCCGAVRGVVRVPGWLGW